MTSPGTSFILNGQHVTVGKDADEPLVEVLRDEFGLTSVRTSCGIGICGTCAVLLDGQVVSSCLLLLGMLEGRTLETTEGVDDLGQFQDAFIEAGAYQCSFCIPAMVLTAKSVAGQQEFTDAAQIEEQLAGNLCRCGSYPQIRDALQKLFSTDGA